jgi:hypothetical protein
MKAYQKSGGTVPLVLNLDTRCKWTTSRSRHFISPQKTGTHWVEGLVRTSAGMVEFGEEKYLLPIPGFERRIVPVPHVGGSYILNRLYT